MGGSEPFLQQPPMNVPDLQWPGSSSPIISMYFSLLFSRLPGRYVAHALSTLRKEPLVLGKQVTSPAAAVVFKGPDLICRRLQG